MARRKKPAAAVQRRPVARRRACRPRTSASARARGVVAAWARCARRGPVASGPARASAGRRGASARAGSRGRAPPRPRGRVCQPIHGNALLHAGPGRPAGIGGRPEFARSAPDGVCFLTSPPCRCATVPRLPPRRVRLALVAAVAALALAPRARRRRTSSRTPTTRASSTSPTSRRRRAVPALPQVAEAHAAPPASIAVMPERHLGRALHPLRRVDPPGGDPLPDPARSSSAPSSCARATTTRAPSRPRARRA